MATVISPALTKIFQQSLDSGKFPDDWRCFKKGDKYLPSNYRPISLTCVPNKILKHIITSNFAKYLENQINSPAVNMDSEAAEVVRAS